jgi:hypothetical protein
MPNGKEVLKDVEGFVAEFRSSSDMLSAFMVSSVSIPKDWNKSVDNFKVVTDDGVHLELCFYDWDQDKQIGEETFWVDREDVITWA